MPSALLANDDPTQLAVIAGLLRKDGFQVFTVTSGDEALEFCSQDVVDLVVCDLNMPGLSGDQLLVRLRSSDYPAFGNVPVLLVSASPASLQVEQRCQELQGSLLAPYRLPELRRRARELFHPAAETAPAALEEEALDSGKRFDPGPLDKLIQAGGLPLAQRIVELFTTKTPAYLRRAAESLAQGQQPEVEQLAHSIKGSAGMVGALEVQRQADELEQSAGAGGALPTSLQALETAFEASRVWLNEQLDR